MGYIYWIGYVCKLKSREKENTATIVCRRPKTVDTSIIFGFSCDVKP